MKDLFVVTNGMWLCAVWGLNSLQGRLHCQYMEDLFVELYLSWVTKGMWFVPCQVWTACRADCTIGTQRTCLWSLMICALCHVGMEQLADQAASSVHEGPVYGAVPDGARHGSLMVCGLCCIRSEQPAEWIAPPVHEGPVCGAVPDSACETQLPAALPAPPHGPACLRSQRLADFGQPGET